MMSTERHATGAESLLATLWKGLGSRILRALSERFKRAEIAAK